MKKVVLTDSGGFPSIADKRFTGTDFYMKRVVLTDSGGFSSIADKRFTGTQRNINVNNKLNQETANIGFHVETHVLSSVLPQVVQQKDATTIERKYKFVIFLTLRSNSLLRYLSSLRSILHDTMFYIRQCLDFYTICSYSIACNIGFPCELNILYVYKLDTYMEALCLNAR
ncbi:hypothetical protein NIES4075_24730 [Tolypothrix sp. NIES-4075]|nr:hypothetical protein NIES4075_24730 [Tolypothrix sp. NIES-4075]